jgi:hypothetical protein
MLHAVGVSPQSGSEEGDTTVVGAAAIQKLNIGELVRNLLAHGETFFCCMYGVR